MKNYEQKIANLRMRKLAQTQEKMCQRRKCA